MIRTVDLWLHIKRLIINTKKKEEIKQIVEEKPHNRKPTIYPSEPVVVQRTFRMFKCYCSFPIADTKNTQLRRSACVLINKNLLICLGT